MGVGISHIACTLSLFGLRPSFVIMCLTYDTSCFHILDLAGFSFKLTCLARSKTALRFALCSAIELPYLLVCHRSRHLLLSSHLVSR